MGCNGRSPWPSPPTATWNGRHVGEAGAAAAALGPAERSRADAVPEDEGHPQPVRTRHGHRADPGPVGVSG